MMEKQKEKFKTNKNKHGVKTLKIKKGFKLCRNNKNKNMNTFLKIGNQNKKI